MKMTMNHQALGDERITRKNLVVSCDETYQSPSPSSPHQPIDKLIGGTDETTNIDDESSNKNPVNSKSLLSSKFAGSETSSPLFGDSGAGDGMNNTTTSGSQSRLCVPFLPDSGMGTDTSTDTTKTYPPLRQSSPVSISISSRTNSRMKARSARNIANRADVNVNANCLLEKRKSDIHHDHDRSMMVESKHIERGSMKALFHKNTKKSRIKRDGSSLIKRVGDWGHGQWIGYCFWLILALTIQLSIGINGSWAFPDGREMGVCPEDIDTMDMNDNHVIKNKSMCLLAKTLADGADSLRILSAFILGGFLVGSVQLWLERRTAYTALCGATRNLLINVCSIIPNPMDKKLFARWAVLGFELSVLKGRGLIDYEEGRAYLDKLHLIEGDEWHSMVSGDRHTTVWFWIQVKAENLMRENEIQGLEFQTICQAVTLSRDMANDLMSCINRDQPPPYTFVCGLLININLLLLSLATGTKWAIMMYDTEGSIWKEPRMYAEIFILFFNTSIYAMLFDLCTLLYNPFGPRKIDIMHHEVGGGIRQLAKSLSTTNSYPSTMMKKQTIEYKTGDHFVSFVDQEDDERNIVEAVELLDSLYDKVKLPQKLSFSMGMSMLGHNSRR